MCQSWKTEKLLLVVTAWCSVSLQGFKPRIFWSVVRCFIQLSYRPETFISQKSACKFKRLILLHKKKKRPKPLQMLSEFLWGLVFWNLCKYAIRYHKGTTRTCSIDGAEGTRQLIGRGAVGSNDNTSVCATWIICARPVNKIVCAHSDWLGSCCYAR